MASAEAGASGSTPAPQNKRKWSSGKGFNKKKKLSATLARGFPAILCTCDRARERQAVVEALNILEENRESDSLDDNKEETTNENDIDRHLKNEIESLKDKSTRYFESLDTGVSGLVLIKINDKSADPIEMVNSLFRKAILNKKKKTRIIARLIPLQVTCYPGVEEFKTTITPLIQNFFEGKENVNFAVEYKKRNCESLNRTQVIDMCVELVGEKHKVNLSKPDAVIVVEIFKNVCGMSIVQNYHEHDKFNLRTAGESNKLPQPSIKSKLETNESTAHEKLLLENDVSTNSFAEET